jgi:hypothetical protein
MRNLSIQYFKFRHSLKTLLKHTLKLVEVNGQKHEFEEEIIYTIITF